MAQGKDFKGRQFTAEVILWAVRWSLMFPISYRDLELMLQDRGVEVDHTTLFRWIQAYAPELEKRIRPHLRACNGSWRVDETYVKARSQQSCHQPPFRVGLGADAAVHGDFEPAWRRRDWRISSRVGSLICLSRASHHLRGRTA